MAGSFESGEFDADTNNLNMLHLLLDYALTFYCVNTWKRPRDSQQIYKPAFLSEVTLLLTLFLFIHDLRIDTLKTHSVNSMFDLLPGVVLPLIGTDGQAGKQRKGVLMHHSHVNTSCCVV